MARPFLLDFSGLRAMRERGRHQQDRSLCMFQPAMRAVAARPKAWRFCIIAGLLAACSGEHGQDAFAMQEEQDLTGTMWQVEDIDGGGTIDNSQLTIEIPDTTQIAGSAGCNRYAGSISLGSEEFRVSVAADTQRTCVPAINDQERRFLAALLEVRRYVINDTVLQLFDERGRARLRAVAISDPVAPSEQVPMDTADPAVPDTMRYTCDEALVVAIRLLRPDTLGVTLPDGEHILERDPDASGARYSGDGVLFWDKGDEALLDIGGVAHRCRKE